MSSYRPREPAAPSITIGNATIPNVDGMAAMAQTRSRAGTTIVGGATSSTMAATAYDMLATMRDPLYQGTIRCFPWRNAPTGIASRNPPTAGIAVSR